MSQANALITVDEAARYLDVSKAEDKDELDVIIDEASDFIESWCDRILKQQTLTEYYSGDGCPALWLRQWPVTAVSSVGFLQSWNPDVYTTESLTGLVIDPRQQYILFRDRVFPSGHINVKVGYTAGYLTIPSDLKQACKEIVADIFRMAQKQMQGVESITLQGQTTRYILDTMPKATEARLWRYRRQTQ